MQNKSEQAEQSPQTKENLRPVISLEGWIARDGIYLDPPRLRFFINEPHRSDSSDPYAQRWYASGYRCDLPEHILRRLTYHSEPIKARLEVRLENWKEDKSWKE